MLLFLANPYFHGMVLVLLLCLTIFSILYYSTITIRLMGICRKLGISEEELDKMQEVQ